MHKAVLVGDCHSARVNEHHDKNEIDFEFNIWGVAGKKAYQLDLNGLYNEDRLCSGIEVGIKPGDHPDKDDKKIIGFKKMGEADIVLAWLGYVDIRTFLPRHDNSEKVVRHYVREFAEFYPNSRIQFIEPLPQFKQLFLKYDGISPEFTFEERQLQNKKFNYYLNEYTEFLGLPKPITQDQLFEVIGLDYLDLEHTRKHPSLPHPTDGLDNQYNKKLYDFFVSLAKPLT